MTSPPKSRRVSKVRSSVDPTQYTPFFAYRPVWGVAAEREALYCEGVSLEGIARATGTPVYVYSRASIEAAYRGINRALGSLRHTVCYSVKANGNLAVLRVLAKLGSSFDIVSGGELDRLGRIGVAGHRIVFSGVGKTREEIREAIRYSGKGPRGGFLQFNVESAGELEVLLSEATRNVAAGGRRTPAAIRVNPDVMAGGHPRISTGHHHHKFGVDWQEARRLYLAHKDSKRIAWRGISAHLGSQISSVAPYRRVLTLLASYVRDLRRQGIRLETIDIGGGLGIRYTDEPALAPSAYARALRSIVQPLRCRLLIEPGRAIVGPAGVLVTRVLYVKENRGKTFVVVDAAINDLIRPALYNAIHAITPAVRRAGGEPQKKSDKQIVDIVGPICESTDVLARDWPLEPVKPGDLLVIWTAGAYCSAWASNYNARRRAAEILVEGSRFVLARSRESYDDLVRGEMLEKHGAGVRTLRRR